MVSKEVYFFVVLGMGQRHKYFTISLIGKISIMHKLISATHATSESMATKKSKSTKCMSMADKQQAPGTSQGQV
jgi:hypothetical protein